MSNFYVNRVDQGDAVCVRMNPDPDTWDNPIENLAGSEMACGFNGTTAGYSILASSEVYNSTTAPAPVA